MKSFLRIICWLCLVILIAWGWEQIELTLYGISQHSIVDTAAAMIVARWGEEKL